jgi:hypothetical protein
MTRLTDWNHVQPMLAVIACMMVVSVGWLAARLARHRGYGRELSRLDRVVHRPPSAFMVRARLAIASVLCLAFLAGAVTLLREPESLGLGVLLPSLTPVFGLMVLVLSGFYVVRMARVIGRAVPIVASLAVGSQAVWSRLIPIETGQWLRLTSKRTGPMAANLHPVIMPLRYVEDRTAEGLREDGAEAWR